MAKPHPRPTAPPMPMQQRLPAVPKPDAPVLTSVAFGRTESGRYAAAVLTTQGAAILSCDLVCPPTSDAMLAEDAWREAAYPALFHGTKVPTVLGPPLVEGEAIALFKTPDSKTAAYALVLEEGRVVTPEPGKVEMRGGRRYLPTGGEVYTGRKLDAWQEAELYAGLFVLTESLADSRRRAGGSK